MIPFQTKNIKHVFAKINIYLQNNPNNLLEYNLMYQYDGEIFLYESNHSPYISIGFDTAEDSISILSEYLCKEVIYRITSNDILTEPLKFQSAVLVLKEEKFILLSLANK